MKIFSDLDPNMLPQDPRIIFSFRLYLENLQREKYFYLLRDGDYLLWARRGMFPAVNGMPEKWIGGVELEFPIRGLPWFVSVIEQKFLKTEAEGGLPKGEFTYAENIMNEELTVARMLGDPGYSFRNYSRQDYAYSSRVSPQQANFADEMLFDKGLFDQFKAISESLF